MKAEAIGRPNGLEVLRHEAWILDFKDSDKPCAVPPKYLRPMAAARSCAQEMLMDQSLTCLADVQRQLKANASLLLSMDRSFRCELEWLETSADAEYSMAIHRAIIECMPSHSTPISMAQACTKLDSLIASDKAKFSALRSQSEIQTARKILDKMVAGVSPNSSVRDGGSLFAKIWDRLQYFVSVEIPCPEAPPW
jgi:hypothetical protein